MVDPIGRCPSWSWNT